MKTLLARGAVFGIALAIASFLVGVAFTTYYTSRAPCSCICEPVKCPEPKKCKKCPKSKSKKCSTMSSEEFERTTAIVESYEEQLRRMRNDLHSCRMGQEFESFWFKEDLKTYGKPWHKVTEEEMRKHDLYQKHLKKAKKWLDAILADREECE